MIWRGYVSTELLRAELFELGKLHDPAWTRLFDLVDGRLPYVTLTQKRVYEHLRSQRRRIPLQSISADLSIPSNTVYHALESLRRRGAVLRERVTDRQWTRGARAGFRMYYSVMLGKTPLEAFIEGLVKVAGARSTRKYFTRKTQGLLGVQGSPTPPQKCHEIIRLYTVCQQNKNQIAKAVKVSPPTVTRVLRDAGIPEKPGRRLKCASLPSPASTQPT